METRGIGGATNWPLTFPTISPALLFRMSMGISAISARLADVPVRLPFLALSTTENVHPPCTFTVPFKDEDTVSLPIV